MYQLFWLTILGAISAIYGGTPCPPREFIHPCVCTEIQISKKARFTLVTCQKLPDTSALEFVFHSFRLMEIDRLMLVDCFLESKFGKDADKHRRLPRDWWTYLRIRELEIIDSVLAPSFACDASRKCENSYQTRISIVNSSFTRTLENSCEISKNFRFSWVGCLVKLKHFDFQRNKLTAFDRFLFPVEMKHLEVVNMSHNAIHIVENEVFKNLPALAKLDLSGNQITHLPSYISGISAKKLKVLDLSFNNFTVLPPDLHRLAPNLRTLNLRHNEIKYLSEKEWKELAVKKSMRLIDLSENKIVCDCYLGWLNASLPIHTVVLGTCSSPEAYTSSPIRRASRLLSSRCNSTRESIVK